MQMAQVSASTTNLNFLILTQTGPALYVGIKNVASAETFISYLLRVKRIYSWFHQHVG